MQWLSSWGYGVRRSVDGVKERLTIGILGRTNVGKSTLFNRMLGTFRAIVTDIPGTTREIIAEDTMLVGIPVTLLDSPWLADFEEEIPFLQRIIEASDVLLFVGDGKLGRSAQDDQIAHMILSSGKKEKTIVIVNKMDGKIYGRSNELALSEWREFGFDELVAVSAQQHEWLEQLSDVLTTHCTPLYLALKNSAWQAHHDEHIAHPQPGSPVEDTHNHEKTVAADDTEGEQAFLPLVIIGRPNTGKSTLLNTLVGEDLSVVSPVAGTTLDYITAEMTFGWERIRVYDTAGMRKKGKIVHLEKIAYEKTMSLVEYIKPVVVVMCDLSEGLTHRDKTLLGELIEKGMPVILVCNKIDLFSPREKDHAMAHLKKNLPFSWIPVIPISAHQRIGLVPLMRQIVSTYQHATTRLQTAVLNKILQDAWVRTPPRFPKNKICKWKYITQVDTNPPTFMLSVNNEEYANFSFRSWCENVIRKHTPFWGVPLRFVFQGKKDSSPFL
jgi:GTP-binding protein